MKKILDQSVNVDIVDLNMKPGPDKNFEPTEALEAAMGVFWARGFEAAALSELTSAMGIGKQSLYNTFGNKRALFIEAIKHYTNESLLSLRDTLFDESSGSYLANLRGLLDHWRVMHSKPGSHGCMIGTNIADFDTEDEEVCAILRDQLKRVEDSLTSALQKAQANGELSDKTSPRDIARTVLCLSQGMALLGRIMEDDDLLTSAFNISSTQLLSAS
ncbi:MAG: TetR/AcrR family transcriptional regulator [Verrucomicrobiota bacterium]